VLNVGGLKAGFRVTTLTQDTTPNPFRFGSVGGAKLAETITSNSVTVVGFNSPASISVSNEIASYSIDNGPFGNLQGSINPGQSVRVRSRAPSSPSTSLTVTLSIGGVDGAFTVRTADDTRPNDFDFKPQTGLKLNTQVTSNAITVSGVSVAVPIQVSAGEYSINGGVFTKSPGTVSNGDVVRVRITSGTGFSKTNEAVLAIGTLSRPFLVTTEARDNKPNAFSFTGQAGVKPSSQIFSNTVTISGINVSVPVSLSSGEYSINGAAFTTARGTINAGQTIRLRMRSSALFNTETIATVIVGNHSAQFVVTTSGPDTTPDNFSFPEVVGVKPNTDVLSREALINGINSPAPITIAGSSAYYSIDGGEFIRTAGTVSAGQSVQVRIRSGFSYSTAATTNSRSATVTIGGVETRFRVENEINEKPVGTLTVKIRSPRKDPTGRSLFAGDVLDISYTYKDPEGDPEGNSGWYRNSTITQKFTTYTLPNSNPGMLKIGYQPKASIGNPGGSRVSQSFPVGAPPQINGPTIYWDANTNQKIDAGDQIQFKFNQTIKAAASVRGDDFTFASDNEILGGNMSPINESSQLKFTLGAGSRFRAPGSFIDVSRTLTPGALVGSRNGFEARASKPVIVYKGFTDTGQLLGKLNTRVVKMADFDGDGDLDLVFGNTKHPDTIWINDGKGNFKDSGQRLGATTASGSSIERGYSTEDIAIGDIDRDGSLDIVTACYGGIGTRVYLNNGKGVFTHTGQSIGPGKVIQNPPLGGGFGVDLGDIDKDGDLDMVVASAGTNGDAPTRVWINNGKGIFSYNDQSLGTNKSHDVKLGDLNGDGHLDLALAQAPGVPNIILFNDGKGQFYETNYSFGSGGYYVEMFDVDKDGDLDINSKSSSNIGSLWINDGRGNFTKNDASCFGHYWGDYDGDGLLDLYAQNGDGRASSNPTTIIALSGRDGSFCSNKLTGLKLNTIKTERRFYFGDNAFGDIDGDGDIDMIEANGARYENAEFGNTVWKY